MTRRLLLAALLSLLVPDLALAAPALDGAALPWTWALPFVGILLTIATGPLLFPRLWHHHYGKLAFVWATLTLAPMAALHGAPTALGVLVHGLLAEYMSFIVLLFALYVVAGGILVTGNLRGTPVVNAAILAFGTVIASLVGTTGAAMILIRPLLRANAARLHNVHVVVFFIILVANVGGALSPLGDPPLFIGFLHGVDFFWTTQRLLAPTAFVAGILLAAFVALDLWFYRKDRLITTVGETEPPVDLRVQRHRQSRADRLHHRGDPRRGLVAAGSKLRCLRHDSGAAERAARRVPGSHRAPLARLTREEHREANGFTWDPILEVAILFAGIFACILPVMAMLTRRQRRRVRLAPGRCHDARRLAA